MDLPTAYQQFIHMSRYSRWIESENRRETWEETVDRFMDYMCNYQCDNKIDDETKNKIKQYILELKVLPSMRALMTAGPALKRDSVAAYNCAYLPINRINAFDEMMYCLMNGTGVGFSVEQNEINKLPQIPEEIYPSDSIIQVRDSKIGWCTALKELIGLLYSGVQPKWDLSKLRPAGARLKTFGGRSSGPDVLDLLFRFIVGVFKNAKGRKLRDIEVHDVCCKIAEIVTVGGVRRSALISLSDLGSLEMRKAKSGEWWSDNAQRALSNNSAVYNGRPSMGLFMKEWQSLYESKSGERGIFNREAAKRVAGLSGRRDTDFDFGCNPCSEILLRGQSFCNLTTCVVRPNDNLKTMKEKIEIATILGTMQSTITDFRYLGKTWKKNCEEERLLGVSLNGICDNKFFSGKEDVDQLKSSLEELKQHAVDVNKKWADILGINPSAAITCIKPEGSTSQLVNSASGMHPRYSEYYIRTVRGDMKDPLSQFLIETGVKAEPDVMSPNHTWVFSFPVKSPGNGESIYRDDLTAIEQLELWLIYQKHWCEHKPSITVYVKEHEWLEVGCWVYKHFEWVSGIAFLPHTDHAYQQAPYQEINEEKYNELLKGTPELIDFINYKEYDDMTISSQELACSGNSCDIVDMKQTE